MLNMAAASAPDVPLQVVSDNARSERRISPSWTIGQLKTKLEPITGIPAASQRITIRHGQSSNVNIDDKSSDTTLDQLNLIASAEIHVGRTISSNPTSFVKIQLERHQTLYDHAGNQETFFQSWPN